MSNEEIKFDALNYRTHDEKNLKLIKKSLKELGAGRSIVIDAEGEIIAGNATYKQAHNTAAECAEFYAGEAKEERFSKAIQTAAEDICERRARDFYLLMTEAPCK